MLRPKQYGITAYQNLYFCCYVQTYYECAPTPLKQRQIKGREKWIKFIFIFGSGDK
jgi:hypothetical protein